MADKQTRPAEYIAPGDIVTVPMTVVSVRREIDAVYLDLSDSEGNGYTVRHTPGDGITEVERPKNPQVPPRMRNAMGMTNRPTQGPV